MSKGGSIPVSAIGECLPCRRPLSWPVVFARTGIVPRGSGDVCEAPEALCASKECASRECA